MLNIFFLNNFDHQTALIFLAHRSNWGITVFTVISFLGNWQFLVPAMLVVLLTLFLKNKKKFIIPFSLVVISAEIITFLGKILFHRPRPLYAVFAETDFSFPSGHATIAVAFYGYLAYILVKSLKNRYNWVTSLVTFLIIVLIGFSRLYLGVHYVSDVLTGYIVGSALLTFAIFWTEKSVSK